VIHRDIKPANIRIRPDGKAFLVDFGLVKVYDPHLRTTVGARAVTPGYSPPEQYGRGNTDSRTDVYALAATLYTLLTGLEPQESVQRVVSDQLVSLDAVQVRIQPGLGQVVGKAMQIQPSQRYSSVSAFEHALKNPSAPITGAKTQIATQTMQMASPAVIPVPQQVPMTKKPWFWPVLVLGLISGFFLIRSALDNPPPTQEPKAAADVEQPVPGGASTGSSSVEVEELPNTPSDSEVLPTYTLQPTYTPYPTNTPPPPAIEIKPTNTNIPPTDTRRPTDPPRPTSTPQPPDPEFTANLNMFCRDGPGSNYEDHTMVLAGETVPVYAKWDNNWLLVGIDKSSTRTKCCWIGGDGSLNVSFSSIQTINYLVDRITCNPK
jgi:serine/threonine protein kinase